VLFGEELRIEPKPSADGMTPHQLGIGDRRGMFGNKP
jgi:hypothetical protein